MAESRRSIVAVRLLFVAAILTLPLMLLARETVGETYPGLFQPEFGTPPAHGTRVGTTEPYLVATDSSGATHRLAAAELEQPAQIDSDMARRMLRSFLNDPARLRSAEGRSWLRARLRTAGVDGAVSVVVEWRRVRRDVRAPDEATVGRVTRSTDVGSLEATS